MTRILTMGPGVLPRAPVEIADEVELYARESGRTASLRFVPLLIVNGAIASGAWVVDFSLRVNDARMKLWRDGKAEKPVTEQVWLWQDNPNAGKMVAGTNGLREPPKIGLELGQMGAAGVRAFLERGNSWGRGEYTSTEDALRATREHNAEFKRRLKAEARDENRVETRAERRWRLKIPFLPVKIEFGKKVS